MVSRKRLVISLISVGACLLAMIVILSVTLSVDHSYSSSEIANLDFEIDILNINDTSSWEALDDKLTQLASILNKHSNDNTDRVRKPKDASNEICDKPKVLRAVTILTDICASLCLKVRVCHNCVDAKNKCLAKVLGLLEAKRLQQCAIGCVVGRDCKFDSCLNQCCTGTPISVPVNSPITVPVEVPISTPVSTPITVPVASPIDTPISTPVSTPITVPVASPIEAPISTPVSTPITVPVASPIEAPIDSPVASPIEAPIDSPVASPITVPTSAPIFSCPLVDYGNCITGCTNGSVCNPLVTLCQAKDYAPCDSNTDCTFVLNYFCTNCKCKKACTTSASCSTGYECNTITGFCAGTQGTKCSDKSECGVGYNCLNGICSLPVCEPLPSRSCFDDSDCPSFTACDLDGVCKGLEDVSCSQNSQCLYGSCSNCRCPGNPQHTCDDKYCNCKSGICTTFNNGIVCVGGSACLNDFDCMGPTYTLPYCVNGFCHDSTCRTNSTCPAIPIQRCNNISGSDASCPSNTACYPISATQDICKGLVGGNCDKDDFCASGKCRNCKCVT